MKRILLISLLLILVLGFSASAIEPKIMPTLTVEFVAPIEGVKLEKTFWVDIYVSSNSEIGKTFFQLTSTPGLEFTGKGVVSDELFKKGDIELSSANFVKLTPTALNILSKEYLLSLAGKKKFASVELIAKNAGVFTLSLKTDASYSYRTETDKYVLSSSPVTISAGCIPKLKTCSDFGTVKMGEGPVLVNPNCGYLDNGCGTAIKCGECNTYCVNNVCMPSEIVLFPPTAEEKELCKNVLTVTSGSPENTKTEINLFKGVVSALKEQTFNAKFSGIVTALTTWFKAAKQ